MVYITAMQSPRYKQMSLEDFLFGDDTFTTAPDPCYSNTYTFTADRPSDKLLSRIDVACLILKLRQYNSSVQHLRTLPRQSLYREFHIPKKSGGLRKIDAPNDELMDALRRLKTLFENDFHALYHTSAFAYVKKRSTVDAVKRHQENESKWFAKFDLSNFFGSTTIDFVMQMFSMVFPFSEVVRYPDGKAELQTALELAFLNGGLPQGTPISPLITNVMMIPVDHALSNGFRDFNNQRYVYTRYADDFLVSSRYNFNVNDVQSFIVDTLKSFNAPFTLKPEKTRYGSSAGRNWNLGIMLNANNEMTVGHKNKRRFQAMLSSYIMDRKNGRMWDVHDIQVMEGLRNYYRMIEGEPIDRIVEHIDQKFGVNVRRMIKEDLSPNGPKGAVL